MLELKAKQLELIKQMEDPPRYPNGGIKYNFQQIIFEEIQEIERKLKCR